MDGRANDKKDRRSAGRYCISGMGMVSVGKQTETPRMRTHGRGCGEKGTPITLLTIDVPEKHILLSDFDYWHFVLNDIPLRFSKDGKIENCSETEKLKSWEKIFDITYRIEGDEDTPMSTQAVLWEIKKEWLIKAENFITR